MKRSFGALIVVLILLTGMFWPVNAQDEAFTPTPGTEILWDMWGVPHIYAEDNPSLFYAFGWAQMHNHADLILQLYAGARGEAASVFGADFAGQDSLTHSVGVPAIAQQFYDAQSEAFRSYLDAFVAGMNAYAAANPDAINAPFNAVLPVRPTDPLALAYNDVTIYFVAGGAIGLAQAWGAGQVGSNAWAISPERSESGNAMMIQNPHLPWSDVFVWFESHLNAPGVNLYGASLVGLPGIEIGFNDYLGWTHTVNTHDGWDLYEITLTPDDSSMLGGYLIDGEPQTFEVSEGTIQVLQEDGTLAPTTFPMISSVYGPVIAFNAEKALALRVVQDSTYMMEQWWQMGTATNLEEFEDAMSRVQIPMFNTIYADRDGHIYYLFNAQVPVREQGDFDFWQNIQPGEDSSLIWAELHPYEDLPKLIDPATGWVQNANEPPWTSTIPPVLDMTDYPPYMSPQSYYQTGHIFRPQASQQMLAADESISFEELLDYKHNTRVDAADHVLDDLIAAARESGDETAMNAADVLEAWDRQTNADSQGALLFIWWFETFAGQNGFDIFATPFDIEDPFNTPSGLADPQGAVATLVTVADDMMANYGALDVPYGDVMRLRVGEYDLPGNGGSDPSGVFRAAWYAPTGDGTWSIGGGDSWVAVVEFSDPIRAQVLIGQGNATQPGSPHVGDQLELFSAQEMREPWLTRDAVEANLEATTTFD